MAYILKEKLKGLKNHIRAWNTVTYGSVDLKIATLVGDIQALDIRSEVDGLTEGEVVKRKELFSEMWHLRMSKTSVLAQRARLKWLREGDANTRYFHASIKSRGKTNFIRALRVDNVWLESPTEVRGAAVSYFREHFSSVPWCRPNLDGILFPALSEVDNALLICPFGLEEIESVVKTSDGNK
jgi:hypothetical protein